MQPTTAIQTTAPASRMERKTALEKLRAYAEMDEVKKRFINLLGDRDGRAYVESVVIAVANNENLQACTPKSIMVSAMRAASLKLSVDPAMQQAHLVPFRDEATLIIDYHGLVQLSVNTNYYRIAPNVSEVWEGEEVKIDRFTGEVTITGEKTSDIEKGWVAFYEAKNGIKRWLYMTNEECDKHGETYNPNGYNNKKSAWNSHNGEDRRKMRRKTCLRIFIKRWGNFSPVVQNFITADESPVDAEAFDMPDDGNIKINIGPEIKHSAAASVSILQGEGNPDPIKDSTWADWEAWKARAEKVKIILSNVDRAGTTEANLRDYLVDIAPGIIDAEKQAEA